MSESEFVLKATPPRMPRAAMRRHRLARLWQQVNECVAVAVVAPAGFGKTTLLLQWRQRWLEQGTCVAWLTADAQDDPGRFTMALLHAAHAFQERAAGDAVQAGRSGIEALTWMLSEIARRRGRTVLMIDDAERLPEATVRQTLQYLLLNAPANLHVAIGSRVPLPLRTAELVGKGSFLLLATQDLRLQLEESVEILQRRLGARLSMDERARLHEATEGWPIGLQLAIAAIEHEDDAATAVRTLSARRGSLQEYFVDTLVAALSADAMDVLTRVAILDHFNEALCELLTGAPVTDLLERLARETPIMMAGERAGWFRLHPLARDFLLGRFEQMPAAERTALHARASAWYARHERFDDAARHALAAGDEALARDHAARALWALGALGKVEEAREWLARTPAALSSPDLELRLGAAAVLAFSDRNAEGLRIASEVLADPATPPALSVVAMRVASGAAGYADHLGSVHAMLAAWPPIPPGGMHPLYTVNHLNARAFAALHEGRTDETRALVAQAATYGREGSLRLAAGLGCVMVGMSHLWDGNPRLAEQDMRASLELAEREDGRRGMIASLIASVLAPALLQLDQPAAAQALLANRLDVIERCGFPDNLLLAYRTLVYVALAQGDECQAFTVLDSLDALARRRKLPRLRLQSLAERIRILALKHCTATADELVDELDALAEVFARPELRPYLRQYELIAALAKAYVALARNDVAAIDRQLDQAAERAAGLRRGREARVVKVLRAVAARQRGNDEALPLLMEATTLASLASDARLLANTHPLALEMAAELKNGVPRPSMPKRRATPEPRQDAAAGLLTAKEAEVLRLLELGMSNKRIALTLDIGGETVKSHLKNLFSKLSAVSREHAVDRARLLGLLA
jgi:LuxR family maltose regulon positive regulatory protein